jgi:hypothetical protein
MWKGAMQESTTTWDLRTVDYTFDGVTRVYVFFLLVVVIWSIVTSVRFWWMTSALFGDSGVNLSRLWDSFAQNDLEEVHRLSSKIAKRLPEYGLSAWSNLKAEDSKSAYIECFSVAQVHFQSAVSRLQATSQNLFRLIVLTLIFACGWFFNHIFLVLKGVEASKAIGISALSGGLGEIAGLVSFTAFLLAFVYVVRWWMIARLERRKREWKRFAGMLQTVNMLPRSGGSPPAK